MLQLARHAWRRRHPVAQRPRARAPADLHDGGASPPPAACCRRHRVGERERPTRGSACR